MAWPSPIGFVQSHPSQYNALVDALQNWGGDANANAHSLRNAGSVAFEQKAAAEVDGEGPEVFVDIADGRLKFWTGSVFGSALYDLAASSPDPLPTLGDLDSTSNAGGVYYFGDSTVGTKPGFNYGSVIIARETTSDGITQIAVSIASDGLAFRRFQSSAGGWQAWRFPALNGHGHAIAEVSGLQGALDGKSDDGHRHIIADVSGLWTALDGKALGIASSVANRLPVFADTGGKQLAQSLAEVQVDGSVNIPSGASFKVNGTPISTGGGAVAVESNGSPIGSEATLNLIAGSGVVLILSNPAGQIDIQVSLDTAVALTKAALQSGTPFRVAPASASGSAYTASMSPTLTIGSLIDGAVFLFEPDVSNSGACSLNIDALGAKSIKLSDGTSNPAAGDLAAGSLYWIAYDGTVFRVVGSIGGGGSVSWGDIGGTVSAQSDLQSALDGKANVSHAHVIADVSGLQAALDAKAAAVHGHAIADTSGLQSALDGKAAAAHTHGLADLTATGAKDSTTFLRGDNTWAAPAAPSGVMLLDGSRYQVHQYGGEYNNVNHWSYLPIGGTGNVAATALYPSGILFPGATLGRYYHPKSENHSLPLFAHGSSPRYGEMVAIASLDTITASEMFIGFVVDSSGDTSAKCFGIRYKYASGVWEALIKDGASETKSTIGVTPVAGQTHRFKIIKTTTAGELKCSIDGVEVTINGTIPTPTSKLFSSIAFPASSSAYMTIRYTSLNIQMG